MTKVEKEFGRGQVVCKGSAASSPAALLARPAHDTGRSVFSLSAAGLRRFGPRRGARQPERQGLEMAPLQTQQPRPDGLQRRLRQKAKEKLPGSPRRLPSELS